jgi:hypothetical protein
MNRNEATRDCNTCPYWRGLANRQPGVRIPHPVRKNTPWELEYGREYRSLKFASGKCIRPGGHCEPHTVRD